MTTSDEPAPSPEEREAQEQLRQAIRAGELETVQRLCAEHPRLPRLSYENQQRETPLGSAVHDGQREIAEWLVEHGAPFEPAVKHLANLPLCLAVSRSHAEMARWLLSLGASLDAALQDARALRGLWLSAVWADGTESAKLLIAGHEKLDDPAQVLVRALLAAAEHDRVDILELLYESAEGLGFSWSGAQEEALSRSVGMFKRESIRFLLDRGVRLPAPEEIGFGVGRRCFSHVLGEADESYAKLIIEAGFDIAAFEDRFGSLLVDAFDIDEVSGESAVLSLMLDHGLDPNRRAGEEADERSDFGDSGKGATPLFNALCHDRVDLYRFLLKHGADLGHANNQGFPYFATAGAARLREKELRALASSGVDINAVDSYRGSAIHNAVEVRADRAYIELLIELGARLDVKNDRGHPPLRMALETHKPLAKLLLKLGADPLQKDDSGQTALDYATREPGFKQIATQMQKQLAEGGVEVELSDVNLFFGEPWAAALKEAFADLEPGPRQAWQALLSLAVETNATRPSKTFLKKARGFLDQVGIERVRSGLLESLPLYREKIPQKPASRDGEAADLFDEYCGYNPWTSTGTNVRALRGLLWACIHLPDAEVSAALREVAAAAFKKVPHVGMRNAKVGNAALNTLAATGEVGLRQLVILKEQTRYNPAKVNIERVLDRVCKELKVSPDELAELGTSDYGLTEMGRAEVVFGDCAAELLVAGPGRVEVAWKNGKKTQKTVPAKVKSGFAAELKKLKVLEKDLKKATLALRNRLEKLYLEPKAWEPATWRERYLDHPVAGVLSRRLIWRMRGPDDSAQAFLWREGELIDVSGAPVSLEGASEVELWHPLHDDVDAVLAWRARLQAEGVVQPFKQAHREVYVVTDAERATGDHSLRFADQIVVQAQLHALAEQRAWSQVRGGHWDGGDETDVWRTLPSQKIVVVYATEPLEDFGTTPHGIYLFVRGGELRFHRMDEDREPDDSLAMVDVPPLVFSETMRDVDLFVSVANAGNDPEWEHRNRVDDWERYLDGDLRASGETRRETLEALIPKLKVADRLSLEGRYLTVRGDLMTYRIHLGSANVMMETGRYLCIVRKRDLTKGIVLPYEGDTKLSEILSKALLLAADKKIKDEVILDQLRGS